MKQEEKEGGGEGRRRIKNKKMKGLNLLANALPIWGGALGQVVDFHETKDSTRGVALTLAACGLSQILPLFQDVSDGPGCCFGAARSVVVDTHLHLVVQPAHSNKTW